MNAGPLLSGVFPDCLVPAGAATWAQGILDAFPGIVHAFGFECPLSGAQPDFAVLVLPEHLGELPFPLRNLLGFAWYSFEAGQGMGSGPSGIHLGLDEQYRQLGRMPSLRAALSNALRGLSQCTGDVQGDEGFPEQAKMALESLPDGAVVWNISRIFSRPGKPWKLNLTLSKGSLVAFLGMNGWGGDKKALDDLLERFLPDAASVRLDLGFSPQMAHRIGIEIFLGTDRFPAEERIGFLDKLEKARLCPGERKSAIGSWRGLDAAWPDGSGGPLLIIRNWYVKLVLRGDGSLASKVYLYAEPTRLPVPIATAT